jgi:hypothetical protein
MERENLDYAIRLVSEIEHLEKISEYIEKNTWDGFGSCYTIRFSNELSYAFPPTLSQSMFNNVLKTSIESDLERLKNKLKEL